jgi:hypothetical protein
MQIVTAISGVLAVAASIFAIKAATVEVRDNLDEFIGDLRRQSRWSTLAAVTAAATVLLDQISRWAL